MDLNGPGTSLFQGNELNNFDNLEQLEEEEALEEQRRRDLELKNALENAFDDVSFDNEEESVNNASENRSNSAHSITLNNSHHEVDDCGLKGVAQSIPVNNNNNNLLNWPNGGFNTSFKQGGRSNPVKIIEFNNDHENFTDDCRKKLLNGSLHDIVDQSGGGDQNMQTLMHYNHCFQRSPLGDGICNGLPDNKANNVLKSNFTEQAEDSGEQLKILYDVRVREVHRLTELIDSLRSQHEIEVNDLKHQLALVMAEKERTNISHSQLQSLLVDCKQQVEHLLNDVNALEKAKKELEASKKELMIEFDTAKLTIDDLQRKVLILEKGNKSKTEAEQYEYNIKCLTEKHNFELMNMKKELDNYIKNNEILLKENEELKLKIIDLSQLNDENLAKKSEIISRLSEQIEKTQNQCENLMKLSTTEDNFRLQAEIKILKEEKLELRSKIESLEKEITRQEDDLKQYEFLNRISFFNSDCDFKDLEGSQVSGKLGSELYRALSNQKAKRLEIQNLNAQLNEKKEQILTLIENEKTLSRSIENLKEEIKAHLSKLKDNESIISKKDEENINLQKSLEEFQEKVKFYEEHFQDKYEALDEENNILKNKIAVLEKEKLETMSNYNEEYLRFHNEGLEKVREETEKYFKTEMLKKDAENESLKKEIEEIKLLYVELCNAKESSLSHPEKDRNSSGRSSAVDLEEVKRLQKELEKSRHRILELDQTLKQQYEQEVEVLNLDINQLKLQIEKLKKEKDREVSEKDKTQLENELLKTEIEQVTSQKNLLFLDNEKLQKEMDDLRDRVEEIRESSESEMKKLSERHSTELQNLSNKYEIIIKKLKKEVELTVTKAVKCESKYTSPMKTSWTNNASTQGCSSFLVDKSTSPIGNHVANEVVARFSRDVSVLTDPEPVKIPKKEIVEIMKKLGAHHEQEIMSLEKKYSTELLKLEKKFNMEIDKAKEIIYRELKKEHQMELDQLEEKHRIEMENRIEQEKNEAVVDLITEWACEVQSLKVSYAESQAEMEKMKMKYKAAKSVALQYKTYFKSKAEHMKEEWKRIEDGYERALKELEKNVHILVDVKEDEVKAKVDSITKLYEDKINKMKEKLTKCENKLKAEKESGRKKEDDSILQEKIELKNSLEKLSVPDGNLCQKLTLSQKKKTNDVLKECRKLLFARVEKEEEDEEEKLGPCLKQEEEAVGVLKPHKRKHHQRSEALSSRGKTSR